MVKSDTWKNPKLRNLTLEKDFMKLVNYKNDKINIKFFEKIFFYASSNTIMKLFLTLVYMYTNNYYIIDISRSSYSGIPPLNKIIKKYLVIFVVLYTNFL